MVLVEQEIIKNKNTEQKLLSEIEVKKQRLLKIDFLSESEFNDQIPSLRYLQALVYTLYTKDQNGNAIEVPIIKNSQETYSTYLVASHPYLTSFFRSPNNEVLKQLETELQNYSDVAGFLRIEWGSSINGNQPIEAMKLMKWDRWPNSEIVGYAGSFTTNPLLPKELRLQIQRSFHHRLYELANKEGFSKYIFAILGQNVVNFVRDSGIQVEHFPEAIPNWEDSIARQTFEGFPRYWQTDPPPQLYRFIPFK